MKTILAPIDFSAVTARVVDEAANLAHALGGRVVLVHVTRVPQAATEYALELGSLAQLTTTIEQVASRRLEELEDLLEKRGVVAESMRVTGAPAVDILTQAEQQKADYIVIGSHGHAALYDLVFGSTAGVVIKQATCPVIVVPASRKAEARRKSGARARAADKEKVPA